MFDDPTSAYPRIDPWPTPAAGAGFTITPDRGDILQIVTLQFTLATAVAVANRTVIVVMDDGQTEVWRVWSTVTQAAALTVPYTCADGLGSGGAVTNSIRLPAYDWGFLLLPGWNLSIEVDSIQPADQISNIGTLSVRYPLTPGGDWAVDAALRAIKLEG